MGTRKVVLLSFDLEEFDMPLEYGYPLPFEQQLAASDRGMEALLPVLDQHGITATFFTTASYAQHRQDLIRQLAAGHEIASHTFYHSEFKPAHLASSRQILQAISGQEVTGLRMPRMRPVNMADVAAAGYRYDSSINPTYLPGRYNNLHLPRTVFWEKGIPRLPASVSPRLRIPLFWLLFKNVPLRSYLSLCRRVLHTDGYLNLYFHPWEFTDLKTFGMPHFTIRQDGRQLTEKLERLIGSLSEIADFEPTGRFMHNYTAGNRITKK